MFCQDGGRNAVDVLIMFWFGGVSSFMTCLSPRRVHSRKGFSKRVQGSRVAASRDRSDQIVYGASMPHHADIRVWVYASAVDS